MPELRRFAVNNLGAIFNWNRLMRISVCEDAAANAIASFEDDHFAPGFTEISGSSETSRARADHKNCLGIQAWLRLSICLLVGKLFSFSRAQPLHVARGGSPLRR